jgi:hypothetical protein
MSLETDITEVQKGLFKPASPEQQRQRAIDTYAGQKTGVVDITAHYGIAVEYLIGELLHKHYSKARPDEVDNMLYTTGLDKVKNWVRDDISANGEDRNIQVLSIEFSELDSGNFSHAVAYYDVVLRGEVRSLKTVANDTLDMYYEWED